MGSRGAVSDVVIEIAASLLRRGLEMASEGACWWCGFAVEKSQLLSSTFVSEDLVRRDFGVCRDATFQSVRMYVERRDTRKDVEWSERPSTSTSDAR